MSLLKKIQSQPYETKLRILWSTVTVTGIILIAIFIFTTKQTLSGVKGQDLLNLDNNTSTNEVTKTPFASVERVERTEKILKIYFNFHNTTDDILNISKLQNIRLSYETGNQQPSKLTDRQSQLFVQKILSHTQNFGILTFNPIDTDKATLTFDQMFMEKSPNNFFKQTLELNLDELSTTTNLRN